jgi:hypothetical protein
VSIRADSGRLGASPLSAPAGWRRLAWWPDAVRLRRGGWRGFGAVLVRVSVIIVSGWRGGPPRYLHTFSIAPSRVAGGPRRGEGRGGRPVGADAVRRDGCFVASGGAVTGASPALAGVSAALRRTAPAASVDQGVEQSADLGQGCQSEHEDGANAPLCSGRECGCADRVDSQYAGHPMLQFAEPGFG